MNILIFTNRYPFGIADHLIEPEFNYLKYFFNEIYLIPLHYGESDKPREVLYGIKYCKPMLLYRLNDKMKLLLNGIFNIQPVLFAIKEFYSKKVYSNPRFVKSWLFDTCLIRILLNKKTINKILNQLKPDSVLYFYWGDKQANIIPFLRKKIKNRIIVRFHGSDLYDELRRGYIPFRDTLLKNITASVFISETGYKYLINRYPFVKSKSWVFRLGVYENGINSGSNDGIIRILTCSNVVKIKRLHILVEALAQLTQKIEWTHIGDGLLLNSLMNAGSKLPENIKVNFKRFLTNSDVIKYYKLNPVDLFINLSESEGIPVSIMEALSFSIPVIATNVGGVAEIVNENVGMLIEKDINAQKVAEKIEEFMQLTKPEIIKLKVEARMQWENLFDADKNFTAFASFLASISI